VLSAAITGVFTGAVLGRRIVIEQFDERRDALSVSPGGAFTGMRRNPIFKSRANYRYL